MDREKNYVVVVQCDQAVSGTCAGFQCEWAFTERLDAFDRYPKDKAVRYLPISCGGCPGRAVHRKLMNVKKGLKKREQKDIKNVMVHLSSCMTRDNHHGPRCPHIDYIKTLVKKAGFEYVEDSRLSPKAIQRRAEGLYAE